MNGPPKKERRLCGTALEKLQLQAAYRIAALLANTFGWPFWFFEQWRGRLADRIDNEEDDP
jgi:hypothetical protein